MKIKIKKKSLSENTQSAINGKEFIVSTSPVIFLKLAEKSPDNLKKRSEMIVGDFDPQKAGDIFLSIDPETGRIIEHSGRARSYAAAKKIDEYQIKIRTPYSVSWDSIPKTIISQDGSEKFNKDEIFTLISVQQKKQVVEPYRLIFNGKLLSTTYSLETLKKVKNLLPTREIAKIKKDTNAFSDDINDYYILTKQEKENLIQSL